MGSDGWVGSGWGMGLLCWSLKLLWLGVMSVSMMAMTRSESGLIMMTAMKMVGLESRLTWIMKILDSEVGVGLGEGEGVEAVGLSGFVVEVVVVVGLPIWC